MTSLHPDEKVFLSYTRSSVDWAWMQEFVRDLARGGTQVWSIDQVDHGQDWRESLESALWESTAFVIFLDSQTLESPWVQFELGAAMAGEKAVIPVLPPGSDAARLPVPLSSVTSVTRDSPSVTAEQVARALAALTSTNGHAQS